MATSSCVKTWTVGALAAAGLLYASPGLAAGLECSVAAIQAAAPADATVTSAEVLAKPVPLCKVEGFVTTNNPGPNKVNFRLQLPSQNFANRYYFIGMGGAAGSLPTESQFPGGNPVLGGYAVAGTDTGHTGHLLDWGFLSKNRAQAIDHIDRGAHVVAVATQAITRAYYGSPKLYRYYSGCSGGGRMGVMDIERHPEDFDGVLLGAPGGRSTASMLKFIHAYQQMIREPGSWLSPAKLAMVDKTVTSACDMTDGAKDGVVWDHRLCHFDVATLQCKGADGPDCLTAPEIRSIKAILAGPKGPKGESIVQPMPISNMSVWSGFLGFVPPPWSPEASVANMPKSAAAYVIGTSMARVYFGDDYDVKTFDFKSQKTMDAWWAAAHRIGYGIPYSADLRPFAKTGHKVIMWNGRSDPCCGDLELQQYYLEGAKSIGATLPAFSKIAALYQVPGMGHCGCGTGPQDSTDRLLQTLVSWVEGGSQPGPVVTHRGADKVQLLFDDPAPKADGAVRAQPPSGGARDFLLCPYPTVSTYGGKGAVEDAANWSCVRTKPGDKRQG